MSPAAAALSPHRRRFLQTCCAASLGWCFRRAPAGEPAQKLPLAGAFDREVEAFMEARRIPGGALAVVKDRRLVYARGYGWADRDAKIPARAESLFRIASVSKPLTAVAVLKLVEAGQMDLEARAFDLVRLEPILIPGRAPDERLKRITLRQLLQHTGGWDRNKSFDPMFRCAAIADAAGEPGPPGPETIIRYMLGRPLEFDPGTRYAYSNFGYCVLGRVIERLGGQPYERFVRERVLAPLGIRRMRIGASLAGSRAAGEARYYLAEASTVRSVFPGEPRWVPAPDGSFHLEAMDAHGGWIASVVDLARFAAALEDAGPSPLLKPASLRVMYAPPDPPVWRRKDGRLEEAYYGCGWMVRPVKGGANYWHAGSLPGTSSLLVRRRDGLSWVVLFNQRSTKKELPDEAIDAALHRAADAVAEWPAHDLFQTAPDSRG